MKHFLKKRGAGQRALRLLKEIRLTTDCLSTGKARRDRDSL
jgi:hypothetical protein